MRRRMTKLLGEQPRRTIKDESPHTSSPLPDTPGRQAQPTPQRPRLRLLVVHRHPAAKGDNFASTWTRWRSLRPGPSR